jgi:ribosomal protein L37E
VQDKFNFFIPVTLEKGTTPGQEMKIKGICSSEEVDSDGETLVPAGYDIRPLLETGFLNYNHQGQKTAAAIIGEPTVAEIINNGKDLYIEGFLYPDSDEAKAVFKLAQTLEKNSSKRRLGFSIEGKALERASLDKESPLFKRITKARITGVAITAMPKNPNTLLSIMKGEYSEPFMAEDEELDKAMTAEAGEGVTQKESVEGGIKDFNKLQADKNKDESKTCPKCDHDQLVKSSGICLACGYDENKKLKKSEVYDRILAKYSDLINNDIQKAQQIYKLTQEFNTKLYNMDNNSEVISKALENCFTFIDSQIDLIKGESKVEATIEKSEEVVSTEEQNLSTDTTDVVKSEESDEVKTEEALVAETEIVKSEEEVAETEEVQAAEITKLEDPFETFITSFAKSELQKGLSVDEVVDNLVLKGMDADVSFNIVKSQEDELDAAQENSTAVSETEIVKAEEPSISNQISVDLIKSELIGQFESVQKRVISEFQTRFDALGKLMKSQADELGKVTAKNAVLEKSLSESNALVQKIASQSQGTRSVTRISAAPVERFPTNEIQKSQSGKEQFDLTKAEDITTLTDRLSAEYDNQFQKGQRNEPLANAVFELSVAKGLDKNTLQRIRPTLSGMNIEIVN